MDAVIAVGEREELLELRAAQVRDHRGQPRVPGQHLAERSGTGEAGGDRRRPRVHHDRCTGFGQHPPHRIQQGVSWIEAAHLQMRLEGPRAAIERRAYVRLGVRLGEQRRGGHAVRRPGGEVERPVVQRPCHSRLVRIRERGERSHAERAQVGEQVGLAPPVVDWPGPADKRPGRVEVRPHALQQPRRHEVDVHVDQSGQPESAPKLRHVCVVVQGHRLSVRTKHRGRPISRDRCRHTG
jgi:hypothetical protein